ncbi:MAG: hypothetical protein HKO94_12325 [Flavobacteriaceae bacterium]|nr:hypothetical protein [Flavobacteriaceae bacterium]
MSNYPYRLFRLSGVSLCLAGILLLFVNVVFTPQILAIDDFAQSAASSAWGWRLGLASLTGLLLLVGSVGIYTYFNSKLPASIKGLILLVLLILGNGLLLAHEWNQWLFVRDLAINFPDVLNQLEDLEGFTLFDLSAALGVSAFFLSWIISPILLWTSKVIDKRICILMILGIIASPFVAIITTPLIGGIVSSLLLGSGWFLLGRTLITARPE